MAKLSKRANAQDKRAKERNVRIEAAQLLGKWTSLARGHVVMGGNCSCGLGSPSLQVQEFEEQILDYLHSAYGARDACIARGLRERAGFEPGKGGSLSALLRSIAADAQPQSPEWLSVMDGLKRTLESFEQAHRGM